MKINDKVLSLTGDTFAVMKGDFDKILNRTIGNMELKGANEATITLKLGIVLDKTTLSTPEGLKDITNPVFKHDISSVMQVKDKMSGQTRGNYSMEWDPDEERFVLRKVDDGQASFHDDGFEFFEADYEDVENNDVKMLPGEVEEAEDAESTPSPFEWLSQFVGEEMKITEAMGNYTVRTTDNKVVLSSATAASNMFYCPIETLKDHIGHQLICVSNGTDHIESIAIECEECNAVLYELSLEETLPVVEELEVDDYEYEEPED